MDNVAASHPQEEEEAGEETTEVVEYNIGGIPVRLCMARESAAAREGAALPAKSTGTSVWPAALVLARYLVMNPHILASKRVVELGAGSGLSGLVAANYSTEVWLTDKDDQVLGLLGRSIRLNPPRVRERTKAEKLVWGEPVESSDFPSSFDVVLASDTMYYLTAVESMWRSVDALLSRTRCADGSAPLFIMTHVNREKLIDSEMMKVGQRMGFVAQVVPLSVLYPPGGEPVPSNEHVTKQMLRLFIFTRAQHLGGSRA